MIETKFKQTEVGLIPDEWEVINLPRQCSIKARIGWQGLKSDEYLDSGDFYLITGTDFLEGYISWETCHYVSKWRYEQDTNIQFKDGDILITKDGTIGKVAYISKAPGKGTLNSGIFVIRPLNQDILSHFLQYVFKSMYFDNFISQITAGSTIVHLYQKDIVKFNFPLPSLPEQRRIAEALSDVDALITSLGKLIEKKRNIKLATMQKLLTGKKRLKGFSEPWTMKQLGKIGNTFSGLTGKTKEDFGIGNAKYITFLNVLNNPILKPELFENVVIREGEKQNSCHKGDLFFNTSSETPEEVGICAMLDSEFGNLYLNSFCFGYRLTDKNVVPEYLAYFFRSTEGRKLMTVLAQGVTRYNMSKSAFNNAKIHMSSDPSEQKAIAGVLRSMDKEIEAIVIKKKKYSAIKQGMMKQLLTGKIRLI